MALIPAHISHQRDQITLLTAPFLHAGWLHLIGNMVFLWVLGPAVEDLMGAGKFLDFHLLGGQVASTTQILIDPNSSIPNLGASGAIAAVMVAFLINFPCDRIRTVLILAIFIQITTLPAMLLIGIWFILQLVSQLALFGASSGAGVAFMDHIGGFLFDMAVAPVFFSSNR